MTTGGNLPETKTTDRVVVTHVTAQEWLFPHSPEPNVLMDKCVTLCWTLTGLVSVILKGGIQC